MPYFGGGRGVLSVNTPVVRKPVSVDDTRHKARPSSPTDTSSTTESATCDTTRVDRTVSVRRPLPTRLDSRSAATSAPEAARRAGNTPNASAVSRVVAIATPRNRMSTDGLSASGSDVGTSRVRSGVLATASATPRMPPRIAITRDSVSICRMRRSRPAPMAARTAISRSRETLRLRSRLARFVLAMRSRQIAAAAMPMTSVRVLGPRKPRRPTVTTPRRSFASGNWRSRSIAVASNSASAGCCG